MYERELQAAVIYLPSKTFSSMPKIREEEGEGEGEGSGRKLPSD